MSEQSTQAALVNAASTYYRAGGRFAWRFARGKLSADPAFRSILAQGLLAGRTQLLDLGAGQGLLAAWLMAARSRYASAVQPAWPGAWPAPPQLDQYRGIEISAAEVRRARRAFALDTGVHVEIVHGDIRDADFGAPDAVVIMDVLHYNELAAQERILTRVREALKPGGILLMRIGDSDGGMGFTLSKAVDRAVTLARWRRWVPLHCRPLKEWQALLGRVGFSVRTVPLRGTPFANTLLQARAP